MFDDDVFQTLRAVRKSLNLTWKLRYFWKHHVKLFLRLLKSAKHTDKINFMNEKSSKKNRLDCKLYDWALGIALIAINILINFITSIRS